MYIKLTPPEQAKMNKHSITFLNKYLININPNKHAIKININSKISTLSKIENTEISLYIIFYIITITHLFIIFIKNDIKSVNNEKIKPTVKNKKT